MESQPQNPEFRFNPVNFYPCKHLFGGTHLNLHQKTIQIMKWVQTSISFV